jgi:MFS family permease
VAWRPPRRRQILLVLCLSLLVVMIDNTVLNTALPTLARVLHAGTSSLQWITDAYTLCFAALIPAGALGDRYGRRLSLLGGLAVFALGSAAAAFASGTAMLTGARVVMGLGAAFVMPATLSILNAVFPPKERPQAIAAWSAVTGIGVVIGPTLGGLLLSHFWWGSIFVINIPLVALALAGVILTVPETAEPGGRPLDLPGTVLIGGALFAIVEAPGRAWTATVTLAGLAGKSAAPSASPSSAACPPPSSTGPGPPPCPPPPTPPTQSPTRRPARSPPPAASAGTSADCRAASWPAPRTAPSSTRWRWACASPPASPWSPRSAPPSPSRRAASRRPPASPGRAVLVPAA